MGSDDTRGDRSISDHLHPLLYMAIIGLALWLVLSIWGFAAGGYTDFLLAVVSGFVLLAVVLPGTLWRVWRKARRQNGVRETGESFHDWASGDFDAWQGRQKAANAAVEVLLPFAAVAFGMTIFAIVFNIVVHGAASP